jgi:pimeloyl-ACP methyl ester carboxylesterase
MEKITSHDGIQIAYQRSGTGPPLILVHGTGGSATRWAPVAPTLAEHFSVYAVDRRGRGESGDSASYAVEREYEDIAALLLIGGDSPPLFKAASEAVDAALPNSRIAVMPGQQHVAIDTAPNLFVHEVLTFLSESS